VIRIENVAKAYGDCVAVAEASLEVRAGTIHAVVGENGAGKSTLLGMLAGTIHADRGRLFADDRELPLDRHDPRAALAAGVGMVHQHFRLVPTLSVVDNVILGNEPRRGLFLDRARAVRELEALSKKSGLAVDPHALVADLPVGARQRVEILKVLWRGAKVLVLDEPTAVLSPPEVAGLLEILGRLKAEGHAIVLVTHKLREVAAAADEVTVMRQGRVVAKMARPFDEAAIARAIIGERDVPPVERGKPELGAVHLEAKGVGVGTALQDVSFTVRAGEILGVAGVMGNGQTELVLALAGLLPHRGEVKTQGQIAHLPEDRHLRGAITELSSAENLVLGRHHELPAWGFARPELDERARPVLLAWDVAPPDPRHRFGGLSGGNQQKVVAARELGRAGLGVVLAAEPTRGVDLIASARLHRALVQAAADGAAVLLVSSDLSELRKLSDRLIVMYRGQIVRDLPVAEATDALLGALMTGGAA
jgi:general nucleoside transport system ATP-binding protein